MLIFEIKPAAAIAFPSQSTWECTPYLHTKTLSVFIFTFNRFINLVEKTKVIFVTNNVRFIRKVIRLIWYDFTAFTLDFHYKSSLRKLPVINESTLHRAFWFIQA